MLVQSYPTMRMTQLQRDGTYEDGHSHIVFFLKRGNDKERLKETPVIIEDSTLRQVVDMVLTLGIWLED